MPVTAALYVAGVSRAIGGSLTPEAIEWDLPLAHGWPLYHAGKLAEGIPMMWPDKRLRKRGRWLEGVRKWLRSRRGGKK